MSEHPTSPYAFSGLFPVAWMDKQTGTFATTHAINNNMVNPLAKYIPLYAEPPQHHYKYNPMTGEPLVSGLSKRRWVGLTDEDRQELAAEQYGWEGLCSAVEAKLREKNGNL